MFLPANLLASTEEIIPNTKNQGTQKWPELT